MVRSVRLYIKANGFSELKVLEVMCIEEFKKGAKIYSSGIAGESLFIYTIRTEEEEYKVFNLYQGLVKKGWEARIQGLTDMRTILYDG